jgi:tetratricopeptide (TPR) repeat protein
VLPLIVLGLLVLTGLGWSDHEPRAEKRKARLFSEKGRHHHPIHTASKEAQTFFDQGMTLVYGFNHAEAVRSFRRAAELDPKAAMPHWGIALALGPNYNRDIDPIDDDRYKAGHDAARKAAELSKDGPEHEKAYTSAMMKRFSLEKKADRPELEKDYMKAMGQLWKAYPDDLDAGTLYADSLMVLNPWQLWSKDGKPAQGTEEVIRILETVLRRSPDHIGANHLYIHAMEASPWPERALPSAERLLHLVPWQGHLVHMPCHIFTHTGDHELAARANELGIKADEEYFRDSPREGVYWMMYYSHNIHFLAYARAAQGKFDAARKAAEKLNAVVLPQLEHMPMMEGFTLMPTQVLLRFHRWDDVLKLPEPPKARKLSRAFRHFARAAALERQGKKELAIQEQQAFEELRKTFPEKEPWGFNTVPKVLEVASTVLTARLAEDGKKALEHWRRAVELEDALSYGEPPDWYYPLRESLGAALLQDGQAAEAEKVFRQDLERNRRNGRSLFGLRESLKAGKKPREAILVDLEFRRTWQDGHPLRIADF